MEPLTSSSLDTRLAGMLHTIIIPQNMIILGLWFDGFTGSAGQNWTNLNSNSSHLVISFRVHHLMAEVVVERLIMRTTIEAVLRTYTLTLYVTLTCWCPVNGYYPLSLDWIEDYLRYYYDYWRVFFGGGGAWRSIPDVMTTDPTVAETSHSESQMAVCGVTKGKISKFIRIPPSVQTWN